MAKNVICLDRTKPFSTCHGERTPDDPHYKVHFFQAYKVGKKTIILPFDADGVIVADDRKMAPYQGLVEGKPVMFSPLYTEEMRALVKKLEEKMPEPEEEDEEPVIAGEGDPEGTGKAVDLRAWLRGEMQMTMPEVRAAVKAQKGMNPQTYKEAIEFLVHDIHVISEDELAPGLRRHIGK